jgi:hypothetical protein
MRIGVIIKSMILTEIMQIKNGVDIRYGLKIWIYRPMPPSKSKVVILDEAHQLTFSSNRL